MFAFRHQAVVFEGFPLQAITGGTITPWLPFNTRSAAAIMVTGDDTEHPHPHSKRMSKLST